MKKNIYLYDLILLIIFIILFVIGIILITLENNILISIGTGIISSAMISVIIWIFQKHENKIEKLSIKEVAYDLVKHELMVKVLMINKNNK